MNYDKNEIAFLLEQKRNQGRMARLVGLVWDKFSSPFAWLAWQLWGRRRAIRRMQELAGLTPQSKHPPQFVDVEKVGYIELSPPVPPPNTSDVN